TGRTLQSDEGLFWGFWNAVHPADEIDKAARALAERVSSGPNFAHMMTKTQLNQEWAMSLETAIESEAQAQAICMQTEDFRRAYRAFVTKEKPVFEGD
ncbi:MAG: enoyl-CoA hydratase-related protein, partial [Pseudomonadota bacterium]|nr:enoyl-CoA hydratase-related protein [Pseudomonadota bacterium]